MNTKLTLALILVGFGLGSAAVVSAAPNPAQTTFNVKLIVNKACSVTATDLDFGAVDSTATNFSAATNGSVTVTCSKGTSYTIGLAPSAANGGTANGTGNMKSTTTSDSVAYTLYSNSGQTTVWGNTPSTNTVASTGTGAAQTALTVYGKVASANVTPATNYIDVVTVNVVY